MDIATIRKLANDPSEAELKRIIQKANLPSGGLFVREVVEEGPAGKAGLRMGDVIVSIGGVQTPNMAGWEKLKSKPFQVGQKCQISYLRLNDRNVWQAAVVTTIADRMDKFEPDHPKTTPVSATPPTVIESDDEDAKYNFPDRKALIVNLCPHVEMSQFSFKNRNNMRSSGAQFIENLTWKNIGQQPLVAFEIVIIRYDAFNRRMVGESWTIAGKDSVDWLPLGPGQSGRDGAISYGSEKVFTAIAYVRHARLKDGTIWRVDDKKLLDQLREVAPEIDDFGDPKPDPKPKTK